MDFNLFARIAKLVALFGFILPWVVVSCNDTELACATGVELMVGDIQPCGPLAQEQGQQMDDPDPSIGVIGVFAVIIVGLAVSMFSRARAAAIAMLASSVTAIGLAFFSIEHMRGEMTRSIRDSGDEGAMMQPDQLAGMIQIEEQRGFWVTVIALGVAAILCLIVIAGRRVMISTAPPNASG